MTTQRKKALSRLGMAGAGILALGVLTACGSGDGGGNASATPESLRDSGTITLGIADERP